MKAKGTGGLVVNDLRIIAKRDSSSTEFLAQFSAAETLLFLQVPHRCGNWISSKQMGFEHKYC